MSVLNKYSLESCKEFRYPNWYDNSETVTLDELCIIVVSTFILLYFLIFLNSLVFSIFKYK